MAYSTDFRERVLQHCDEGETATRTAKLFKISRNTIKEWQDLRAQTGSLQKPPLTRTFKKLDPQKLKEFFDTNPDALQREAAEVFGVAKTAIQKALHKIGYTRKKNFLIQRT
jgi:transposase